MDSFRDEFFDTIDDLCEVTHGPSDLSQIIWKAEYLTRSGRWFHYYGITRNGQSSLVAHEFDTRAGSSREIDANTCMFTLLDFSTSAVIACYAGNRTIATEILEEAETNISTTSPEVVRISIERRSRTQDGQLLMMVTDMAFLGFQTEIPDGVGQRLTASRDVPSPKWCRGRHFFGEAPSLVRT